MRIMKTPKYPTVKVPLVGEDGNAFAILGRAVRAMQRAKLPQEEVDKFLEEAKSSTYDHLIMTVLRWFSTNYDSVSSNTCANCGVTIEEYEILDLCDDCYDSMPEDEPMVAGTWSKD